MWYVGMDVHLKSSSVCVLDEHGRRVVQKMIRGPWPKLVEWLKGLEEPFAVGYEASCGYGPRHDALRRRAHQIQVAHPGHLRLIFRSKKKNDRVDAQKLAKLIYLGEVPTVHVPSPEVQAWRGTAERRGRGATANSGQEPPPRTTAQLWCRGPEPSLVNQGPTVAARG